MCGKPVGADVFLEVPEGRVLCVAAGGGVSAGGGVEVSIGAPGAIPEAGIDAATGASEVSIDSAEAGLSGYGGAAGSTEFDVDNGFDVGGG